MASIFTPQDGAEEVVLHEALEKTKHMEGGGSGGGGSLKYTS